MKRTVAAFACFLLAAPAHGQALPKLDIETYGARRPATPGMPADLFRPMCVDDESLPT